VGRAKAISQCNKMSENKTSGDLFRRFSDRAKLTWGSSLGDDKREPAVKTVTTLWSRLRDSWLSNNRKSLHIKNREPQKVEAINDLSRKLGGAVATFKRTANAQMNQTRQNLTSSAAKHVAAVKHDWTKAQDRATAAVARQIQHTKNEISTTVAARAKKVRNFAVLTFIGGCFATGLGIGLGFRGLRSNNQ